MVVLALHGWITREYWILKDGCIQYNYMYHIPIIILNYAHTHYSQTHITESITSPLFTWNISYFVLVNKHWIILPSWYFSGSDDRSVRTHYCVGCNSTCSTLFLLFGWSCNKRNIPNSNTDYIKLALNITIIHNLCWNSSCSSLFGAMHLEWAHTNKFVSNMLTSHVILLHLKCLLNYFSPSEQKKWGYNNFTCLFIKIWSYQGYLGYLRVCRTEITNSISIDEKPPDSHV